MNETKRRILDAGRELFNQYGIADVSQRRIADHLGISPGNLTYHFKKSEDITEALYFELVATMNQSMAEVKSLNYDLPYLFRLIELLTDSFYEYRFFFLDFVHIIRNHDRIRKHYAQLSAMRRREFLEAVQQLIKSQMMRKAELPGEYDFLYDRFHILADFWLSFAEIQEEGIQKKHLVNLKNMLIQSLYPYLTPQGKKVYKLVYSYKRE